jgi:signal transduction histidine kinase
LTNGIALLDPEILGTQLLCTLAEEKDRLARVVDSVVLASRLRSAERGDATDTCDAAAVVRGAVESIRGSLPAAWRLEFEQPSVLVAGDVATIRRVVTSLVDNAVAYSPEGGSIRIRLEVAETIVRLSVEDEGIGVPPEERDRMFEKFYRGEGARAVHADGVGLGLYICRELASRLKGRVEVVNNPERGTTVSVELPLAAFSSAPGEVLASVAEGARSRRKKPMS